MNGMVRRDDGPATDEAARLEGICKTFDQTLLISVALAPHVREPLVSLGVHVLRGVRDAREVPSLAELGEGQTNPGNGDTPKSQGCAANRMK